MPKTQIRSYRFDKSLIKKFEINCKKADISPVKRIERYIKFDISCSSSLKFDVFSFVDALEAFIKDDP